MGFNLKMFFEELEEILDADIESWEALERLRESIEFNRNYAKECGQIK